MRTNTDFAAAATLATTNRAAQVERLFAIDVAFVLATLARIPTAR